MGEDGVPEALAQQLANTMVLGCAPDIIQLATGAGVSVREAAGVYFEVGERLHILWLLSTVLSLRVTSKWQALARANLREDTYRLHRNVAELALQHPGATPQERVETWVQSNPARITFGMRRLQELQTLNAHDFMTLAVGVRELRKLRALA